MTSSTEYKIVQAESPERLGEFVNQNLLLGYEPLGGVCAVQQLCDQTKNYGENRCTLEDRGIVYLQAMIDRGVTL